MGDPTANPDRPPHSTTFAEGCPNKGRTCLFCGHNVPAGCRYVHADWCEPRRGMAQRLGRALMELACERGETHRRLPDGSQGDMWPWAERGWKPQPHYYDEVDWTLTSGTATHAHLGTASLNYWSVERVPDDGQQPERGSGKGYGMLANIEAAETWLAARS